MQKALNLKFQQQFENFSSKNAQPSLISELIEALIRPYNYCPFDTRWLYYFPKIVSWGRWKRGIMPLMLQPNLGIVTTKLCNDQPFPMF